MGYEQSAFLMYLARIPMFQSCTPAQIEELGELAEPLGLGPGDEVIREGDDADNFYVIVEGDAVVERGGQEVARLGPGAYFGELSLFDEGPRDATVRTTSEASLARMPKESFRRALDDIRELRDSILRGMARRLHDLDRKT